MPVLRAAEKAVKSETKKVHDAEGKAPKRFKRKRVLASGSVIVLYDVAGESFEMEVDMAARLQEVFGYDGGVCRVDAGGHQALQRETNL